MIKLNICKLFSLFFVLTELNVKKIVSFWFRRTDRLKDRSMQKAKFVAINA